MKSTFIFSLTFLCICVVKAQDLSVSASKTINQSAANIIDGIKIIPERPSMSDPVCFTTFSAPFGGDCTYQLNVDSVIDYKIYISGKFESAAKCKGSGANDTINIGSFSAGTYKLIYNFIDISESPTWTPVPNETDRLEFTVTESTKVQEMKNQEIINLYPNPCNSYVNIVFPSTSNEKKLVQLFDTSGKIICEKRTEQNKLWMDMSTYNQGVYFVRILNNEVDIYKLIKE